MHERRGKKNKKEIPISSDFKYYNGKYNSYYTINERSVNNEIKKLAKILGPSYSQFFKIYIKKKSEKYVHLHLTGQNRFISKSVYGDKEYIAFTVKKNFKRKVSSFQDYIIEEEKGRLIIKEVFSRNGKRYYYTSPAGRKISRIIRTSKNDFNVSVNKLLEKIKPETIIVSSNFAPKVQHNVLGLSKSKMCVKCGNLFKPINWSGWSTKYLSIYNVYNCEKCNFKLGEQIVEEKKKRKEFWFKMLKLIIIPAVNVILLITTFFLLGMPLTMIFGITLMFLSIFILYKYVKELSRRNKISNSIIPFHIEKEISKIEKRIIQDLSKFIENPKKLGVLESEINELISIEKKAKIKIEDKNSKKFREQLNIAKELLDEKRENLERKLRQIIPKITDFLSHPIKKKGQELKIELVLDISLCKKNNLNKLNMIFNIALRDIELLLDEIQKIELELINYEGAFSREEYGYIIGTFETLEKKIQKKEFSEFFERLNDLIKSSKNGLEEKYSQITNQLQKTEIYLENHDFDKAKKIISSSKELAKSLRLDCLKEEKYIINFDQKLYQINQLEKNFVIHQALLKFSEKYPRITLKELADRVKIEQSEVKRIVKMFIKNKVIPANYDDVSNGIEFLSVMEEIDKLLETFEEWSKKGGIVQKR